VTVRRPENRLRRAIPRRLASRLAGPRRGLLRDHPPGSRRVGFVRLLSAAALGLLTAVLVSCGSSGAGLIPAEDAGPLLRDFQAVEAAAKAGDGDCTTTEAALRTTESDYHSLPSSVDAGLRARLEEGISHLHERALALCTQPLAQTTTGESTSTTKSTPKTTAPPTATTEAPTTTSEQTSTTGTGASTTPGATTPSGTEGGTAPGVGNGEGQAGESGAGSNGQSGAGSGSGEGAKNGGGASGGTGSGGTGSGGVEQ
jgi:hypothetical protein